MGGKSGHQGDVAFRSELLGMSVVHSVRRHEADAAVTMHGVVPAKEDQAVCASVLDRAEPRREVGPVFQSFELAFLKRIIVRDMWAAMGFDDIEIDEQVGDRFGAHAAAAIGVQRQCAGNDALLVDGIGNDLLSEFLRFARGVFVFIATCSSLAKLGAVTSQVIAG